MRLPSLLACSLGLVGLLSSSVSAQTNIQVVTGGGPSTQAFWDIVSSAGCHQQVALTVTSYRFLVVDTSSHSVIQETSGNPYMIARIQQLDSPGCWGWIISDMIDNLSTAQFTRNGVSSATLNVDHIVLSDPDSGKYVIDAHLRWTGVGTPVTTPTRERFCEGELCFWGTGIDQNRNATVTGTVTATVTPPVGSTFTANYSPSAGTQLTAQLENSSFANIVQF
jgi:hypothetical protein